MSKVSSNPDIAEQLRDLHHAWKASVTAPSRLHRCNHVSSRRCSRLHLYRAWLTFKREQLLALMLLVVAAGCKYST